MSKKGNKNNKQRKKDNKGIKYVWKNEFTENEIYAGH